MVLKPDAVAEMVQLFGECDPQGLKIALQNAMFGSGDFFPGPGRIHEEYKKVSGSFGQVDSQKKEWFDHQDGVNSDFVIVKPDGTRRIYSDATLKEKWEYRKKQFALGLWMVVEEKIPGKMRYSYISWNEGKTSCLYNHGGHHEFRGESLPFLVVNV